MSLKKYEEKKVDEITESTELITDEEEVEEKIVVTNDEKSIEKEINSKRQEYKKYADKQKKINTIITSIVLLLLVGCFIAMMAWGKEMWIMYTGIAIMAVVLIATYLSSKFMKKKLMAQAAIYIDFMYSKAASYIYDDKGVKDLIVTPKGNLEDKWFIDAHLYNNLKGTKSRNFAHFTLDGNEYDACDLAANTLVKGKSSPKFLGRFYSVKADIKTNEKVTIFQLKGGSLSVPVDDIVDLKLVEGNDDYCIYSNDENYKKLFNAKLIKELSSFKIKKPLIDVLFSVKDNLISLGIDYEDDFLNIPVDKDFSITNSRKSKDDFAKVHIIINTLITNYNRQKDEKSK